MIKKAFSKNSSTILVYFLLSLILVGLSSFCLFIDSEFNYYPIVVTAISFFFGGIYLFMALKSMSKKIELTDSKAYNVAIMMGGNFLRFAILMLSVAANFLFIYFTPHAGEIEKWVYLLLLISGVPSILNIGLFVLRSKYAQN